MGIASYRMLIAILVTLTRARDDAANFGSVQFRKVPGFMVLRGAWFLPWVLARVHFARESVLCVAPATT
jgi:hypothetical protein